MLKRHRPPGAADSRYTQRPAGHEPASDQRTNGGGGGCDGRTAERDPRRDAHRVGRPDRDGRRPRIARRRLPAGRRRALSGHPHLRPLRQGPRVPGRLPERVAAHGGRAPRRRARLHEPVPELGGRRPGEVGARRLRLRARRLARRRPLAGLHRPLLAARDEGFLRLHRVGRRAALVERQGRPERHLVLRHEPVARRLAAAAASRGDVRVGGRGGLVPRHDPPRRHPLHVLGELVRHAGRRPSSTASASAGRGAASPASSCAATRRCPRSSSTPNRCDFGDEILAHPLDDAYHKARSPVWDEDHRAAPHRGELGRAGAAPARQLRRLRPRRVEGEVARGARHRALDPLLHRLRPRCCRSASSTTSSRARRTAGTSSRACSCRCATSRSSSSGTKTSGRSRARSGRSSTSTRRARC